jgi:hypothetical protein
LEEAAQNPLDQRGREQQEPHRPKRLEEVRHRHLDRLEQERQRQDQRQPRP